MNDKIISKKMMVAAHNAEGEPDFFFCVVEGYREDYDWGNFYCAAIDAASREGYDPKLAYDEDDPAGKVLASAFSWDTATKISLI